MENPFLMDLKMENPFLVVRPYKTRAILALLKRMQC